MKFPAGGRLILDQMYSKYHDLAHGNDEARRQLTALIAGTFAARFGARWGTKSTTVNHPPSKDAIAYLNDNDTLDVWDWQNGTTREPSASDGSVANYPSVAHHFIGVPAFDALAPSGPGPVDPGAPAPPGEIIALLQEIRDLLKVIVEQGS